MRKLNLEDLRILSVSFSTRGIGFTVTEGAADLLDWGFTSNRKQGSNRGAEDRIYDLIEIYQPTLITTEDLRGLRRRSSKSKLALRRIQKKASNLSIPQKSYKATDARKTISNLGHKIRSRRDMALAITRYFPQLESSVPPIRKAWMNEDPRIYIFVALSLAIQALDELP